jgi:hypothetical protein
MLPNFLLPETEVQKDGEGPAVPIGDAAGQMIQLTLGITDVVEQESLEVAVYGSADSSDWTAKPLAAFPPKFYKGTYTVVLDLSQNPDIQFLRVKYKAGRWGHWTSGPSFKCYIFAETVSS